MSNKGYNNYNNYHKEEESFVTEPELKEEAPIEVAPEIKEEEVKKEVVPEIRQEAKPQVKVQPKQKGKVILITRNSCIVRTLEEPQHNVDLYGKEYMAKQIGDIVEF